MSAIEWSVEHGQAPDQIIASRDSRSHAPAVPVSAERAAQGARQPERAGLFQSRQETERYGTGRTTTRKPGMSAKSLALDVSRLRSRWMA